MECKLCGGRGYVLEYPGVLSESDAAKIAEDGIRVLTRGINAVPCPACKAPDVRAMFWAAALTGYVGIDGDLDDGLIAAQARDTGEKLWEMWKQVNESQ